MKKFLDNFSQPTTAAICATLVVFATVFSTGAARAQATASATANATANIIGGLSITLVRDLDFGRMIPSTTQTGTVTVIPISGNQVGGLAVSAGIAHIGGNHHAAFEVMGTAGQFVLNIIPTGSITITGGGSSMIVDNFVRSGAGRFLIPAGGAFGYAVGATLHVGISQPPGVYTGTFDVSVQYD